MPLRLGRLGIVLGFCIIALHGTCFCAGDDSFVRCTPDFATVFIARPPLASTFSSAALSDSSDPSSQLPSELHQQLSAEQLAVASQGCTAKLSPVYEGDRVVALCGALHWSECKHRHHHRLRRSHYHLSARFFVPSSAASVGVSCTCGSRRRNRCDAALHIDHVGLQYSDDRRRGRLGRLAYIEEEETDDDAAFVSTLVPQVARGADRSHTGDLTKSVMDAVLSPLFHTTAFLEPGTSGITTNLILQSELVGVPHRFPFPRTCVLMTQGDNDITKPPPLMILQDGCPCSLDWDASVISATSEPDDSSETRVNQVTVRFVRRTRTSSEESEEKGDTNILPAIALSIRCEMDVYTTAHPQRDLMFTTLCASRNPGLPAADSDNTGTSSKDRTPETPEHTTPHRTPDTASSDHSESKDGDVQKGPSGEDIDYDVDLSAMAAGDARNHMHERFSLSPESIDRLASQLVHEATTRDTAATGISWDRVLPRTSRRNLLTSRARALTDADPPGCFPRHVSQVTGTQGRLTGRPGIAVECETMQLPPIPNEHATTIVLDYLLDGVLKKTDAIQATSAPASASSGAGTSGDTQPVDLGTSAPQHPRPLPSERVRVSGLTTSTTESERFRQRRRRRSEQRRGGRHRRRYLQAAATTTSPEGRATETAAYAAESIPFQMRDSIMDVPPAGPRTFVFEEEAEEDVTDPEELLMKLEAGEEPGDSLPVVLMNSVLEPPITVIGGGGAESTNDEIKRTEAYMVKQHAPPGSPASSHNWAEDPNDGDARRVLVLTASERPRYRGTKGLLGLGVGPNVPANEKSVYRYINEAAFGSVTTQYGRNAFDRTRALELGDNIAYLQGAISATQRESSLSGGWRSFISSVNYNEIRQEVAAAHVMGDYGLHVDRTQTFQATAIELIARSFQAGTLIDFVDRNLGVRMKVRNFEISVQHDFDDAFNMVDPGWGTELMVQWRGTSAAIANDLLERRIGVTLGVRGYTLALLHDFDQFATVAQANWGRGWQLAIETDWADEFSTANFGTIGIGRLNRLFAQAGAGVGDDGIGMSTLRLQARNLGVAADLLNEFGDRILQVSFTVGRLTYVWQCSLNLDRIRIPNVLGVHPVALERLFLSFLPMTPVAQQPFIPPVP